MAHGPPFDGNFTVQKHVYVVGAESAIGSSSRLPSSGLHRKIRLIMGPFTALTYLQTKLNFVRFLKYGSFHERKGTSIKI
jgi:hypothetical protein